jgi:hypothetical protein
MLSLEFSVGAVWKIGFIRLQGTSKSALAPKDTQLKSKWKLGNARYILWSAHPKDCSRHQREQAKVSRGKKSPR